MSIQRPDEVDSETHRIRTAYGKIYVTMGYDSDGNLIEVFLNTGSSGGYTNSWCEALGKTLSEALQSGSDPEELAGKLVDIRSGRVQEDNGDYIRSVPDGVGIAMMRSLHGKQGEPLRGDAIKDDGGGEREEAETGFILNPASGDGKQ